MTAYKTIPSRDGRDVYAYEGHGFWRYIGSSVPAIKGEDT